MGNLFNLSDEEMNDMVDKMILENEKKEKYAQDLLVSRGEELIFYLIEILDENEHIDCDDLMYDSTGKYKITNSEFDILFDALMDNATKYQALFSDEDNVFENKNAIYKYHNMYIQLFIMHGQGTYLSFSYVDKYSTEGKNVLSLDDFLLDIKK